MNPYHKAFYEPVYRSLQEARLKVLDTMRQTEDVLNFKDSSKVLKQNAGVLHSDMTQVVARLDELLEEMSDIMEEQKPTRLITLEVTNCNKCPHVKRDQVYMADSFDCSTEDLFCELVPEKGRIATVGFPTRDVDIPEWCPLDKKNIK